MSVFLITPLAGITTVFTYMNYVSLFFLFLLLIVGLLLLLKQRMRIEIFFPVVLYFYLFLNTLIQNGDIVQLCSVFIREMSVYFIVIYWIAKGESSRLIFNSSRVFDILLVMNAIHMLLTENGFGFTRAKNKIFLLAGDNALIFYIILFVIIHELRNRQRPFGFIRNCIYYLMIIYELIRGEAATSYFVFLILILGLVLASRVAINHFFYWGCGIVVFLNCFFLFVRRLSFMQNLFALLGKDITLSGRTKIWDTYISHIMKSFWLGYGVKENMHYIHIGRYDLGAHNMILSYMAQGGFILFVIFAFMLLLYGYEIKNSNRIIDRYLSVGIFAYLFSFLVEAPFSIPNFYFLLALIRMCESQQEKKLPSKEVNQCKKKEMKTHA